MSQLAAELISIYSTQSYANNLVCEVTVSGRSLMKSKNRSGPNALPCDSADDRDGL
jgi:hypothetical protein